MKNNLTERIKEDIRFKRNHKVYTINQVSIRDTDMNNFIYVFMDLIDSYKTVKMETRLEISKYDIKNFVGMPNISKQILKEKLIGKDLFERKKFQNPPGNFGLKNGDKILNLDDFRVDNTSNYKSLSYIRAEPFKGYFNSFEEEKGFRKEYASSDGFEWSRVYNSQRESNPIDSDILDFIINMNKIDFAYTKGESCSGTPRDHTGDYVSNIKQGFAFPKVKIGYSIIRFDTSDKRFLPFKQGLEDLYNIRFIKMGNEDYQDADNKLQKQDGVKTYGVLIKAPEAITNNKNHPNYDTYLTHKWQDVNRFIQTYIEPDIGELIKQDIRRKRW